PVLLSETIEHQNRIIPHCIKHHPGITLDIVLSTPDGDTSATTSRKSGTTSVFTVEDVKEVLQATQQPAGTTNSDNRADTLSKTSTVPSLSTFPDFKTESRTSLSFKEIVAIAQKESIESKIEQQMVSSLPQDVQVRVRTSTNVRESLIQVIKDGQVQQPNEQLIACLQEIGSNVMEIKNMASIIIDLVSQNRRLTSDMDQIDCENKDLLAQVIQLQKDLASKDDEMKQLQIQTLDKFAQIQKNVQLLLTTRYELLQYPIPRLFIVLPEDASSRNPLNPLSNKFRLYFLCECGEHTKSVNTKTPHHIHLAKHEGYEIARPKEFFERWGPWVLTVLQMLKYGLTVEGVAVPALAQLIPPGTPGQVTESLESLKDSLEPGMDQVIDYIEKVSAKQGNEEASKGAASPLESFLRKKDSTKVLGNLYKILTSEGEVKWVCIDHYREKHHEKAATSLRDVVQALGGSFDENASRVEVTLRSRVQAEQFYVVLEGGCELCELKLELLWDTAHNDFEKLRDTLPKTRVSVLELHLGDTDGPTGGFFSRHNPYNRYDPILSIMGQPSIQTFTLRGPRSLTSRSNLLSRNDDFSNLRHLDISLHELKRDVVGATHLIRKCSNLSRLTLGTGTLGDNDHVFSVYNDIKEHRKYPIIFKDWRLCILSPKKSDLPMMYQQCMTLLLRQYCKDGQKLIVEEMYPRADILDIATTATNGSAFTELEQTGHLELWLDDSFFKHLSSIIARSELQKIKIYTKGNEGNKRIPESIQWEHLRHLEIYLKPGTFETGMMRALVDGVKKASGIVRLDEFVFSSETSHALILPQQDLLQDFVASLSLRGLKLGVAMTVRQTLELLKSADVSRLSHLTLWAKGFDFVKVDCVLEGIEHATRLDALFLHHTTITVDQKSRMMGRGVTLGN
ncbi:hypothetical protein BGX34_004326, partial [Mortierella sp. NVP85]